MTIAARCKTISLRRLKPGNANLQIGGLQDAIQENGVPRQCPHGRTGDQAHDTKPDRAASN